MQWDAIYFAEGNFFHSFYVPDIFRVWLFAMRDSAGSAVFQVLFSPMSSSIFIQFIFARAHPIDQGEFGY